MASVTAAAAAAAALAIGGYMYCALQMRRMRRQLLELSADHAADDRLLQNSQS